MPALVRVLPASGVGASLALLLLVGSACASHPRVTRPPLPPPADAEFLVGADGVRLFTAVEGDGPRGAVWFVLGPEVTSAPLYPRLTAALHEAGFATAVLHARGTGYSDGLRGDVDDYAKVLGDYRQYLDVLSARFTGRPVFLFGHSAGAAFALEVAAHATQPLAGVVLVNPAWRLVYGEGLGPSCGDYVVYATNYVFRPSALTVDLNSSPAAIQHAGDRAEAEAMQADALTVRFFSMRYLFAQREVMDRCLENAKRTKAPLLFVEGAHDALVDPAGTAELAAAAPGAERLPSPDGGHGSSAVETVVGPLVDWLSRHAPEAPLP